jgi:hypothetical protein
MEWNGMEWNGMEWNGMKWNGTNGKRTMKREPIQQHPTTATKRTKWNGYQYRFHGMFTLHHFPATSRSVDRTYPKSFSKTP